MVGRSGGRPSAERWLSSLLQLESNARNSLSDLATQIPAEDLDWPARLAVFLQLNESFSLQPGQTSAG